jgi:branched-chain amino acid transport system substrate-binding protein
MITRRTFGRSTGLAAAALAGMRLAPATAQPSPALSGPPLRIGYSISLSGGLAGNGKPASVAHDVWAAEINANGGLLGRPVQLVRYDDQSSGAQVPAIYTKLLDVDKVDLVISGYATAIIAPAMPIVMQHGMAFVTLLGSGTNAEFQYDRCFNIGPTGSDFKTYLAKGFFEIAAGIDPKPTTVAIAGLDADFQQRALDSARFHADRLGLKIVYDRTYPPSTVDFSPVIRGIQAAKPDIVFLASYPPDSVGLLRATNELQLQARILGGVMIGPQVTAIRAQLGPILNNLVCWDVYAPESTMQFPGMDAFLKNYRAAAEQAKTDPLGLYAPPLAYAQMQVLEQAVRRVGKIDQQAIGADFHANEFQTVIGPIRIAADGEWAQERNLFVQYQGVQGNGLEQFTKPGTEAILYPPRFKSGDLRTPFPAKA